MLVNKSCFKTDRHQGQPCIAFLGCSNGVDLIRIRDSLWSTNSAIQVSQYLFKMYEKQAATSKSITEKIVHFICKKQLQLMQSCLVRLN